MRNLIAILAAGTLFGCGTAGWKPESTAILKDFSPRTGKHCESSAMLNMLAYEGYEVTENRIIGAGAAPGFYYELSNFPFLGGRSLTMKEFAFENLGIPLNEGTDGLYGDGWDKIHSLLAEGHPVVLRVDMRYLPYLFGGKYGSKYMSFGWHMICLAGIDAENGTALVTDTAVEGLQRIKLSDLEKARFSRTKVMPPSGEFYWTERAPEGWAPDWENIALKSLTEVNRGMRSGVSDGKMLAGLDGLGRFPDTIAGLDAIVPSYMLSAALDFCYGSIETNGTGGSAFRLMYGDFLQEVADSSGNAFIAEAAEKEKLSAAQWSRFALNLKQLASDRAVLKDRGLRSAALKQAGGLASEIFAAEKDFVDLLETSLHSGE